jgi:NNP family nitrate/nitrite transporter-like MFS transporter
VVFLIVNSLVDYNQFFTLISTLSAVALIMIVVFLEEPTGHMTEVLEDGTVEIIKVSS